MDQQQLVCGVFKETAIECYIGIQKNMTKPAEEMPNLVGM
jgi:hypothetical protein